MIRNGTICMSIHLMAASPPRKQTNKPCHSPPTVMDQRMTKVPILDVQEPQTERLITQIYILKMANVKSTIFGCFGSKSPQSFGIQIHLYSIM